jgi:hypothetical protein
VLIWLQENAVSILTIAVVVWLGYGIVHAISAARRTHRGEDAADDLARAEKVKRTVREKIADVKASRVPPPVPRSGKAPAVPTAAQPLPPIDPFGGNQPRDWWERVRRWFGGR